VVGRVERRDGLFDEPCVDAAKLRKGDDAKGDLVDRRRVGRIAPGTRTI
jgi:hypothetical protein